MLRCWLAVGITVAFAGCGGGGDTSSDASTTSTSTTADSGIPEAAQPVTELVSALDQLNGHSTCKEALESLNTVNLPDPEGGASARNCKATGTLLGLLSDFEPTDSAEFGTGAVIDGTSGGDPVALT